MKRFLLLAAVAVLCLLLGEAALRGLGFGRPLVYEFDPALFWRMEADQDAYAPSYGIAYRINSRGWRGDETPLQAPPGVRRLLGLGDSVLFGQGVARPETLAGRLEQDPSLEFVNTAVAGYSIYQYRRILEQGVLEYRPQALLLAFVKNDVVSESDVAELRERSRRGLMEEGAFASSRVRRASAWLHAGLGVWARLRLLWSPPPRALVYEAPVPSAEAWRYTIANLDWIAGAAQGAGVALRVVVFPSRAETESGRVSVGIEPILALAERRGFPVVDLHPAFAARAGEGLFLDPVHPNALGNAVAHQALRSLL